MFFGIGMASFWLGIAAANCVESETSKGVCGLLIVGGALTMLVSITFFLCSVLP